MTTETVEDERSAIDVAEDDVSDTDELHRKAEAMRDDEYFDVPILNWEKVESPRRETVELTVLRPNYERETITLDWPEKPTGESTFIKACMVALDVDNPKDAALMADELKDVEHDEFTVPADVQSDGEWELVPEADEQQRFERLRGFGSDGTTGDHLSGFQKLAGTMLGPLVMIALPFLGVDREPGIWFDETETGADAYWFAQTLFYAMIGTILWALFLGSLLLL